MTEDKYQISLAFLPLQFEMLRAVLGERGVRGQGAASTAYIGLAGRTVGPKIWDWARMPSRTATSLTLCA